MKHNLLFAGKNFIRMLLLLAAVSVATFALVSASPIDPLQANVGQAALGSMSEAQKEKLRSYWGVDEPPVTGRRMPCGGILAYLCFTVSR